VDVQVSGRKVRLSPALRTAVEEKVGRLERYLPRVQRAEVHFAEEQNGRIPDKDVCEVLLEGGGHHLRARVAAPDPFAAIDAAVAKLEHQLHKVKTKVGSRSSSRRRASLNGHRPAPDGDED
jgi:putative sigma-54 modulation protein